MNRKRYRINNTWGIDCYERGNSFVVEVFMAIVPWEEVVDSSVVYAKDEANNEFKRLVQKYKPLEAAFVR